MITTKERAVTNPKKNKVAIAQVRPKLSGSKSTMAFPYITKMLAYTPKTKALKRGFRSKNCCKRLRGLSLIHI